MCHIDIADAVNYAVYSADRSGSTCAEWILIHRNDLELVNEYLHHKDPKFHDDGHAVLSSQFFLTPMMTQELSERGVRVYNIAQSVGDAVFIPVGCAHQVCHIDLYD